MKIENNNNSKQEKQDNTVNASGIKRRIEIIDAVRGFAIIMMVIHHLFFNMYYFLKAPEWLYSNPVFNALQIFFVSLFILISGISSRFSRSNFERGAVVMFFAVIVTYVTVRIVDVPIYFGILHLLGTFMIFYAATRKFWDRLPGKAAFALYILLFLFSIFALNRFSPASDIPAVSDILSVLGWTQKGFVNHDNWTILPWIFMFLTGTKLGGYIKDSRFPQWFYDAKIPMLPAIGRNTLIIYVLHQPVLYGITMLILYLQK